MKNEFEELETDSAMTFAKHLQDAPGFESIVLRDFYSFISGGESSISHNPKAVFKASVATGTPILVAMSRAHLPALDRCSIVFGPFPSFA